MGEHDQRIAGVTSNSGGVWSTHGVGALMKIKLLWFPFTATAVVFAVIVVGSSFDVSGPSISECPLPSHK